MPPSPNEIGDAFEQRVANTLNGEPVAQSGGGKWWKLDVRDGARFVWGCKATTKKYIRITKELIREAERAARGMRGSGDGYKPAWAFEIDGEAIVMLKLEDFADIVTGEIEPYIKSDKARDKRAHARQSPMRRGKDA